MERYTIEDIELIRRKSGISYEEAVNLLEYHNGNLAKALVDLERNGRIKSEGQNRNHSRDNDQDYGHTHSSDGRRKASNIFTKLYKARLQVKKGDIIIINLSILFMLLALLISPHLLIVGLLLTLVLGYRITFVRSSKDFAGENFEKMVKNAAQNVKETVSGFTKDFTSHDESEGPQATASGDERSFYRSGSQTPPPVDQTPPTRPDSTTPVSVDCPEDGSVEVNRDDDGYTEATIR